MHSRNERADFVSRIIGHDDWTQNPRLLMQDWDATLLIIVLFLSIMHILLPHFHSRSLDSGCLAAKLLIHSLLTGVEDVEMLTKSLGAYTNYIYRTAVNQMRALPIRLYF